MSNEDRTTNDGGRHHHREYSEHSGAPFPAVTPIPSPVNEEEVEPYLQQGYSESPPQHHSGDSTPDPSRPTSSGGTPLPKHRGRVRFNSKSEVNDGTNRKARSPLRDEPESPRKITSPKFPRMSPAHSRNSSLASNTGRAPQKERENSSADSSPDHISRPRPSVLRQSSYNAEPEPVEDENEKVFSALAAQERAQRIASLVGSHSAPASRRNSLESDEEDSRPVRRPSRPSRSGGYPVKFDDIPLMDMDHVSTYEGRAIEGSDQEEFARQEKVRKPSNSSEAHKLVRGHTRKSSVNTAATTGVSSGQVTPMNHRGYENYIPRPQQYRGGVLGSLLKLYNPSQGSRSRRGSVETDPGTVTSVGSSGRTTPKGRPVKWYNHKNQSQDTLSGLVGSSMALGAQGGVPVTKPKLPSPGKRSYSKKAESAKNRLSWKPRLEDEIRITVHIAETISRQKYLMKLCRALMSYGAPTHRLEEYMKMSARVLEIDGQFLYIPGCMIISFDDASTHTTEVKLVRTAQAVDLGKLKDTHEIYKEVVHDVIGVEEAMQRLETIMKARQKNNAWLLVLVYGCASACVGPFAFQARFIDMPISFILGCFLGFLQLIVAPASQLYSNVFEISAAVITSFLARAFGSIKGGDIFCFSALAQSSIALILPGYMVLCASLELQSKSMVAGSVRMVYAIIYALFLGFGITIGTAFYGLMDKNATSSTTCHNPPNQYLKWVFVPPFTLALCIINQAKWKQMPVMLIISFAGYVVNFFSARAFPSSAQVSNALGALAVGVLGNLYSRIRHGLAAAALLPAIFVLVPSGLAASGSLLEGISRADQITNTSTYANGSSKAYPTAPSADLNSIVFNVGYSMIQIAVGITVEDDAKSQERDESYFGSVFVLSRKDDGTGTRSRLYEFCTWQQDDDTAIWPIYTN
ncbi:putative PRM10 Pheromone-regulated protein [Venustampulla echinocandica]|uniref:Putative PRM10 Pheromone-regulated protein n=1 Tax=Venustampulla echinocandica TaxID=2656787 RepID=A0A370TUC3_9HELO|nr:putative PRM10 Pheromone-regulated protein [Venustampulla echinocandica]RDL39119.1 putative PRM10 Pheromone-regulated protein [Venustampulla echinocandica]